MKLRFVVRWSRDANLVLWYRVYPRGITSSVCACPECITVFRTQMLTWFAEEE